MLRLGYSTTGFARSTDLAGILSTIADLGYAGAELTLDRRHFHPHTADGPARRQLARHIADCGLEVVLSTGGRYALSDVAHEPSLVSAQPEGRRRCVGFTVEAIRLATDLGCTTVMLHSGRLPVGVDPATAWSWILAEVADLAEVAGRYGVTLAFEFHPSMLVATLADYRRLRAAVGAPSLRLTLDVGHVVCTDVRPVSEVIAECDGQIANVHLEDIRGRRHVHLPIGHGEVDFADVFRGLRGIGYCGLINAEFNSGDLEVDECQLARQTFEYLSRLM